MYISILLYVYKYIIHGKPKIYYIMYISIHPVGLSLCLMVNSPALLVKKSHQSLLIVDHMFDNEFIEPY